MMTPFSGLSLILHLTIIGLGKAFDFSKRWRNVPKVFIRKSETLMRTRINAVISVLIVMVLSTLMLTVFGIAIKTGVREGANEWHRRYVKQAWLSIKTYTEVKLAGAQDFKFFGFIQSAEASVNH